MSMSEECLIGADLFARKRSFYVFEALWCCWCFSSESIFY